MFKYLFQVILCFLTKHVNNALGKKTCKEKSINMGKPFKTYHTYIKDIIIQGRQKLL